MDLKLSHIPSHFDISIIEIGPQKYKGVLIL